MLKKIGQFLKEVRIELAKVTWPSKRETFYSTIVVLIFVIFTSLYLGLVDYVISKIIKLFLS